MAVFVYDTFTDTNGTALGSHTGEVGATWTSHQNYGTGGAAIQSNRAHNSTANFTLFWASGTPPTPDYDVELAVRIVTTTSTPQLAFCGRVVTNANSLYYLRLSGTTGLELFKLVAGSATSLGSTTVSAISAGEDHTLKLSMRGSSISGFFNGVQLLTATDTDITAAGRAGMRWNFGSSTTGYHADTITASTPDNNLMLMGVG